VNFDPLGSWNCWTNWDETWHGWLRQSPPHTHKTKSVRKGGSFGGGGEMFNPSVLFFFFFFFLGSLNGPTAYPVRIGWALCTQNMFWW